MAWALTAATVFSTAFGVAGSISSAKSQAGSARQQGMASLSEGAIDQELRNLEAQDIRREASMEADNIKRQAALLRGQMAVAQSGSGVMIGEGSAQAAMDQLDALSSADALAALFSGVNKSVSTKASGRFAQTAGTNRNNAMQQAAAGYETAGTLNAIGGLASIGATLTKGHLGSKTPDTSKGKP